MGNGECAAHRAFGCREYSVLPIGAFLRIHGCSVDGDCSRINGVISGRTTGRSQRPGQRGSVCRHIHAFGNGKLNVSAVIRSRENSIRLFAAGI